MEESDVASFVASQVDYQLKKFWKREQYLTESLGKGRLSDWPHVMEVVQAYATASLQIGQVAIKAAEKIGMWSAVDEIGRLMRKMEDTQEEFLAAVTKEDGSSTMKAQSQIMSLGQRMVNYILAAFSPRLGGTETLRRGKLKGICDAVGLDDAWVDAVTALNVLEAAVNLKLDEIGEPVSGSFDSRLQRVPSRIEEVEGRRIQVILSSALYKARGKVAHAGHRYKPTREETESIVEWVSTFVQDLGL